MISRAVASIPETLERVAYCLRPGGRMLFMKGPDCDGEIAEARATLGEAFRMVGDHADRIPGIEHERRLVVFERRDATVVSTRLPEAAVPSGRAFRGAVKEVSSASNPSFRLARDVLSGRGVRKHGRALISGARIISEIVDRFADRVDAWLTPCDGGPPVEGIEGSATWLRLDPGLFRELDVSGTGGPLLLTRIPVFDNWDPNDPWPDGCTLFIPFQDPENVGAVLRSAAAFGVARAVLLRESAHPFHPKATRAAGPSVFQVPLFHGPSIADLDDPNAPLIPLATDGEAIDGIALARSVRPPAGGRGAGAPGIAPQSPRAASGADRRRSRVAQRGDRDGRGSVCLADRLGSGHRRGLPIVSRGDAIAGAVLVIALAAGFRGPDLRAKGLDRRR